jgi:hypothetical protein
MVSKEDTTINKIGETMRDKKTRRIYCRNRQLVSKILQNKSTNIIIFRPNPKDFMDRVLLREEKATN